VHGLNGDERRDPVTQPFDLVFLAMKYRVLMQARAAMPYSRARASCTPRGAARAPVSWTALSATIVSPSAGPESSSIVSLSSISRTPAFTDLPPMAAQAWIQRSPGRRSPGA